MGYTVNELMKLSKYDLIEIILSKGNSKAIEGEEVKMNIRCHNNSRMGYKESGGELYIRCKVFFKIKEDGNLSITTKYYSPDGEEDKSVENIYEEEKLNSGDLIGIRTYGLNEWVKKTFDLKEVLNHNKDYPFHD